MGVRLRRARSTPRHAPVFVDDTGGRLARTRAAAWSGAGPLAAFLASVATVAAVGTLGGPADWTGPFASLKGPANPPVAVPAATTPDDEPTGGALSGAAGVLQSGSSQFGDAAVARPSPSVTSPGRPSTATPTTRPTPSPTPSAPPKAQRPTRPTEPPGQAKQPRTPAEPPARPAEPRKPTEPPGQAEKPGKPGAPGGDVAAGSPDLR